MSRIHAFLLAVLVCAAALTSLAVAADPSTAASASQLGDPPEVPDLLPGADSPPAVEVPAGDENPLAGIDFYVDKDSKAWMAWEHHRRIGDQRTADLLWMIAREPRNLWYGKFTKPASQFTAKVRRPIETAKAEGTLPLFTVLRAESTKCGPKYMGGGAREDARTRAWYDKFAAAIGDDRVAIAFEPDSLGTVDCLARSRRASRYRLLRYGLTVLSRLPNTTVYMEAGASDWMNPRETARRLRKVGIEVARGFMLNATHYDWTGANIRYGAKVSRLVGGKPFIINTAQNGRGPVHYNRIPGKASRRINVWCNPGMRGLGLPPTTETHHPLVDAYLWVNRPGYAQSCAGYKIDWYLPRALPLARFATAWTKAPPGTRLGHYRRYPLSAFNISR